MTARNDAPARPPLSAEELSALHGWRLHAPNLDRLLAEHAVLTAENARLADLPAFTRGLQLACDTQREQIARLTAALATLTEKLELAEEVASHKARDSFDARTALATRDAHILELAEGVNGLANDAADRARERDAARRDLAEARAQLAHLREAHGQMVANAWSVNQRLEGELAACRRELAARNAV
jgi:chromosome segregation ATPase